jgi:hypothetical protein
MGLLVWAPHCTEKPWCDLDVAKWWAMTVRNRLGCPTGITLRGRISTFFKERERGGGHKGHPWAEGVSSNKAPFILDSEGKANRSGFLVSFSKSYTNMIYI